MMRFFVFALRWLDGWKTSEANMNDIGKTIWEALLVD